MSNLPGDALSADAKSVRVAGTNASATETDTKPNRLFRRPRAADPASKQVAKAKPKRAGRRARRPLGSAVLHAPQMLRAMVRADEIWLVALAAFMGCVTGIAVWLMTETTQL